MRREDAVRLAERLGAGGVVALDLPARSRYPGRLSRRLRFVRCSLGYCLVACRGFSCFLCISPEEPVVEVVRVPRRDVLSGLVHPVPSVRLRCCGRTIAVGEWRGSLIVVEGLDCPCRVDGDVVECWSGEYEERVSRAIRSVG